MTLVAGVGVRDVSPRYPMYLAGYPHTPRLSTGVHDPLLASALCLRYGDAAVLLVAVDILFITSATAQELRRRISAATGVPADAVFVSCSHTHSGPLVVPMLAWREDPTVPPVDEAYLAFLCDEIVDAAVEAAGGGVPAEIAWTSADGHGVGSNRLSPTGITDPEVSVLAVRAADDSRWLALSITYGMHPTVLHEDSTLVSADFPGFTRQHLREALDPELVILYHTAPAGNQSPRYSVTGQTFAEAERLGRMLGARVLDSLQALPADAFTATAALGGALTTIAPTPRALPALEEAEDILRDRVATFQRLQREGAGHGPVRTAECAVFGAEETVTLARAQQQGDLDRVRESFRRVEVQGVRIGDAVMVGMPAETFTEYALLMKERAPGCVVPVSLVNGEMHGYIVTPEAAAEGGYEAMNSLFTPDTGLQFVDAGVQLATQLRSDEVTR